MIHMSHLSMHDRFPPEAQSHSRNLHTGLAPAPSPQATTTTSCKRDRAKAKNPRGRSQMLSNCPVLLLLGHLASSVLTTCQNGMGSRANQLHCPGCSAPDCRPMHSARQPVQ